MARYLYGPFVVLDGNGNLVKSAGGGTVWADAASSVQVTDLTDAGGVAVSTVATTADGRCSFYGPDEDPRTLWVDFGAGTQAVEPTGVVGGTATAVVNLQDRVFALEEAEVTGVTVESMPGGLMLAVRYNAATGVWPQRPTGRADIVVTWVGPSAPPIGGGYALDGVDVWWSTP